MNRHRSLRNSLGRIHGKVLKSLRSEINEDPDLSDDEGTVETDDGESGEGSIDPSLIVPEGLSRRISKVSFHFPPDVNVTRQALTVQKKHEYYMYEKPHKPGFTEALVHSAKKKSQCTPKDVKNAIFLRIPIFNWLIHYNVGKDLLGDVIAGITVAIMHIPQGMAYSMLAGLEPINGIYMAFFPVLIYAGVASSRHNCVGTFAVILIMSGKVIEDLSTPPGEMGDFSGIDGFNATSTSTDFDGYSRNAVASILAFAVGIWMIVFGFLQMGSLCVFLSDMLVSGFTTGASFHVLTSQVPKLFGINSTSYQGLFKIPKTWVSIFANVLYSNPSTMVVSIVCLFFLLLNNEVIKPRLRKITRIPFPIELVVVVIGTVASSLGGLQDNFGLEIIGDVPTGLPEPKLPPFELYPQVLVSSFTITIVSYTVSFSMAKIFAKKLDYPVDATQELYALGLADLMGSMFSCAPISASLSRSLIQQSVGGKTQLASYISCSILVLVLLFIGPFFETLPNCVLASIIAVALKGMFMQLFDFTNMWKISRVDALIWLITFFGVVLLDIDFGLLLGIAAALILLIIRNQAPLLTLLGRVQNTDIYLDKTRYSTAEEIQGIKICQVLGNLHFANQEAFRNALVKTTGLDPRLIMKWKLKQKRMIKRLQLSGMAPAIFVNGGLKTDDEDNCSHHVIIEDLEAGVKSKASLANQFNPNVPDVASLIIDFSGVSSIDVSAAKNLTLLQKEFETADIVIVFAGLHESALEVMLKCGAIENLSEEIFFHSVSDAVAFLTTTPPSIHQDIDIHL